MFSQLKLSLKRYVFKAPFYRNRFVEFGGDGIFANPSRISVKGHMYVGRDAHWDAKGGILIGRNVIFGPRTVIWTYNHDFKDDQWLPYGRKDVLREVVIGDHVWVGYGCIILPGSRIGRGAILGAGSVVAGIVPDGAIMKGNPAAVVGYRENASSIQDGVERFYYQCKKHKCRLGEKVN